jgi:hypothetical protein
MEIPPMVPPVADTPLFVKEKLDPESPVLFSVTGPEVMLPVSTEIPPVEIEITPLAPKYPLVALMVPVKAPSVA